MKDVKGGSQQQEKQTCTVGHIVEGRFLSKRIALGSLTTNWDSMKPQLKDYSGS